MSAPLPRAQQVRTAATVDTIPGAAVDPTSIDAREPLVTGVPGRVSIIVPSYNHERFIEACLDSLVAEDYPDLEVIVIDDGSKDGTFARATAWRERHPTAFTQFVLLTQPNAGLARTLNRLLRLSQGQYIGLLASDDLLVTGGLAARVAALRAHPQWRCVIGDCDVIDGDDRLLHQSGLSGLHGADRDALLHPWFRGTELVWRWSVPGPVLLCDRRIYFGPDGLGFYPEDKIVEDREFYLRVLARGQLGFIDTAVARYRLHGTNISRDRVAEIARQNNEVERRLAQSFGWWLRLSLRYRTWFFGKISAAEALPDDRREAEIARLKAQDDRIRYRWVLRVNSGLARRLRWTHRKS